MNRIPALGYESKAAAARALHEEGKTPAEISRIVGMGPGQVYNAIRQAKPRLVDGEGFRMVPVPLSTLLALGTAADARRVSVNEIARRILAHVATDNLIDAILDDSPQRRAAE